MSNALAHNWNILNNDEHNINYNIKRAQKNVKQIENPLAEKMFKTVMNSYMTNRPVMSDVADIINDEWSMIKKVDNLKESTRILLDAMFYPDLKNLFYEEDGDIINLWIIIKEKNFTNARKYIRKIRQISKDNDLNVEYLIFDLEDKKDVIEQIDMENRNFTEYF